MDKIKKKGISTIMVIMVVALGFLLFFSVLFLTAGIALWTKSIRDQTPSFGFGGSLEGCGIPSEYAEIFNSAASSSNISPSLVAAIFYAGEHGKSWPDINGQCDANTACISGNGSCESGWCTSTASARGPFQFKDGTWAEYGVRDLGFSANDVFDVQKAATGAANMLAKNIEVHKSRGEEGSIKAAIERYNNSSIYIETVYNQYLEYQKCVSFANFNLKTCDAGYRNNMSSEGLVTLPNNDLLYTAYSHYPNHYKGRFELINLIMSVSAKWALLHPNKKLQIGDINAPGHLSHGKPDSGLPTGIDFDLDVDEGMMANTVDDKIVLDPNYNRELALELAQMLIGCGNVIAIGYEDPYVRDQIKASTGQDIIRMWTGHKNHFHVRIKSGTLPITPQLADAPDDSDGKNTTIGSGDKTALFNRSYMENDARVKSWMTATKPTEATPQRVQGSMQVKGVVLHYTAGENVDGAIGTMTNRGTYTHLIIDKKGTVFQLLPLDALVTSGSGAGRPFAVGIEIVAKNQDDLIKKDGTIVNPTQHRAVIDAVNKIIEAYGIQRIKGSDKTISETSGYGIFGHQQLQGFERPAHSGIMHWDGYKKGCYSTKIDPGARYMRKVWADLGITQGEDCLKN